MNVYELYQYIQYIIRQAPASGMYSPEEHNRIMPLAAFTYFKRLFGLPEQYQPGAPIPAIAAVVSQQVTDKLRPLIVTLDDRTAEIPTSGDGLFSLPTNYFHYYDINYKDDNGDVWPVDVLSAQEFNARRRSSLLAPNETTNICCMFAGDNLDVMPRTIENLEMVYFKYPSEPFMDYNINSETYELTYNSGDSTQFDWEDQVDSMQDIAEIMIKMIAPSLREGELLSYAQYMSRE